MAGPDVWDRALRTRAIGNKRELTVCAIVVLSSPAQELEGLDPPMEDPPYPAGLSPEELRRVRAAAPNQPPS